MRPPPKHRQSGCEWYDGEIPDIQLQHHPQENRWKLVGITDNGDVESTPISRKAARILLANGISYGN